MLISPVFGEGLNDFWPGEITESGFYFDNFDDLILVGVNEVTGQTTYTALWPDTDGICPLEVEDLDWPLYPAPEGFTVSLAQ
jgi:hypothetical protein